MDHLIKNHFVKVLAMVIAFVLLFSIVYIYSHVTLRGETLSDEAAATVTRFSFDGDLSGAVRVQGYRPFAPGGNITFAPGRWGEAAVFDGNSGIYLGTNIITSNTYSISMWLNPANFTLFTTAFFGYVANYPDSRWISVVPYHISGTGLWVSNNDRPFPFQYFGQASRIPQNEWSHLVFVVDGNSVTVYVNNVVVASSNDMPADMFTMNVFRQLHLGVNWWDIPFNGMIDEVVIVNNGAINTAGVAQLFTYNILDAANILPPDDDDPTDPGPTGKLQPVLPERNDAGALVWSFDGNLGGAITVGRGNFDEIIREENEQSPLGFTEDRNSNPNNAVRLNGQHGLYLGANVISTQSYTVAFWVKPETLPRGSHSLFFGALDQNRWVSLHPSSWVPASNGGFGLWSGQHWSDNFTTTQLTVGEWQHVAVVVSGTNVVLYLNGVAQDMAVMGWPNPIANLFGPPQNTGHFFLGINHFPGGAYTPFNGAVSDLHIFNRAITPGEVLILYNPEMGIGTDPADTPVLPARLPNGAYHWSFDNDLGGAAEVSTRPDLTNVDITIRGNVPLVPGRVGNAARFIGNSGLYLGENIITGNTYTVAFWAKPEQITNWTSMFFGGNTPRHLSITPRIGWSNGTGAFLVPGHQWHFSPGVIPVNEWTHVAFTNDGDISHFYLNGMRTHSVSNPTNVFSNMTNGQFFLGINLFNDMAFRGLIDELYIFPETALTQTEIRTLAEFETAEFIMPGANMNYDDPAPPRFSDITVHDPSLTRARTSDGYFYVIGTFLGAGRSRDLMQWESINYGLGPIRPGNTSNHRFFPVDNPDPSVETVARQIERADAANTPDGGINFWANEIINMPCGRYFMYYSLSAGFHAGVEQANRSGIGVAIADSMDGPWVTNGMFVASGRANCGLHLGFNWGVAPDGITPFQTIIHTNAIDPSPFFDSQGNFWLVYGSWSGGIFLYEMCADSGLPLQNSELNSRNHGFGELLHAFSGTPRGGIEGAHILFSDETNYYYLFVTTGGLGANDGYNVRILRSRTPYGPFGDTRFSRVNVQRNPTSSSDTAFVDVDGTIFDFTDIGVKILGGYHFVGAAIESHMGTAYLSPGHGGAIQCPDTGRFFKVFHTRWAGRGEWHTIRVHEMFISEAGWPIIAPIRFDGGEAAHKFTTYALAGDYKILSHGRYVDLTSNTSSLYRFHSNGTIISHTEGTTVGTWAVRDGNTADITFRGLYHTGLFLRQFDNDQQAWVQTFTAISYGNGRNYNGLTLWGVGLSAGEAYGTPQLSFDIFNNGEGGSPSRPNASLAATGTIRMWTQLDGVNTPVYLAAADTIVALDQDGECAEEFVRVGRMWQDGIGWLDYFNLVDVNKNGAWRYINFLITAYGQTVDLLLVNANYTPQPPPEFDCDYCEDEGCDVCEPVLPTLHLSPGVMTLSNTNRALWNGSVVGGTATGPMTLTALDASAAPGLMTDTRYTIIIDGNITVAVAWTQWGDFISVWLSDGFTITETKTILVEVTRDGVTETLTIQLLAN
ncbi:MAG: family 43 glycosylhydrolase [Firmicutes bacterium]|nr:family 43 glycosylhydrolase [Bacillota bacterium]